jgi:hypothetical protein
MLMFDEKAPAATVDWKGTTTERPGSERWREDKGKPPPNTLSEGIESNKNERGGGKNDSQL